MKYGRNAGKHILQNYSACAVLYSSRPHSRSLSLLSCLVFGFAFLFAPISPLLFSPADWRKGKGERGGTKKETGKEEEDTGMSSVGGEKWRGREGFAKFLFWKVFAIPYFYVKCRQTSNLPFPFKIEREKKPFSKMLSNGNREVGRVGGKAIFFEVFTWRRRKRGGTRKRLFSARPSVEAPNPSPSLGGK